MPRVRIEFTVEPFRDGEPGPHVDAALRATRDAGLAPDFGPFSTTAEGDLDAALRAVADLLGEAFAAGASRVTLSVDRVP